ncbi:MAG: zinc-dependent peptidase, partial [Planctomycetes bacterium]|nr:zinc-dependent peptidase [Planctomycetota bacterium]
DADAFFTPHAADNEAEFFADLTEAFFCRPHELRALHPELFQLVGAYYRLDPAGWFGD